jgi:hypothetical protein
VNTKIRFKGEEYIIVGGDLETGGAVATREQYRNFDPSYAHYFVDGPDAGKVMRYGTEIGTKEDIEVIGVDDTEVENLSGYDDPGWIAEQATETANPASDTTDLEGRLNTGADFPS